MQRSRKPKKVELDDEKIDSCSLRCQNLRCCGKAAEIVEILTNAKGDTGEISRLINVPLCSWCSRLIIERSSMRQSRSTMHDASLKRGPIQRSRTHDASLHRGPSVACSTCKSLGNTVTLEQCPNAIYCPQCGRLVSPNGGQVWPLLQSG